MLTKNKKKCNIWWLKIRKDILLSSQRVGFMTLPWNRIIPDLSSLMKKMKGRSKRACRTSFSLIVI